MLDVYFLAKKMHQKGNQIMAKREYTSKRVAKIAGKQLKSKSTTKVTKTLAGTALTQAKDKNKKKTK